MHGAGAGRRASVELELEGDDPPEGPKLTQRQLDCLVLAARGNVMEAARALGISRATVYRKLGRRN